MHIIRRLSVLFLLMTACHPTPTYRLTTECVDVDARLERLWNELSDARSTAGACEAVVKGESRCNILRRDIERLGFICATNEGTQLANAVLAYDEKQIPKAQQILDSVLATPGRHPAAAQLRARIALDESNIPFALRFLDQQLLLSPDESGLHELNAAALYLSNRYPEAQDQLGLASRLGAPRWRVAYHLGLIAEAQGDLSQARQLYEEALRLNPRWPPADSRLKGIAARVP